MPERPTDAALPALLGRLATQAAAPLHTCAACQKVLIADEEGRDVALHYVCPTVKAADTGPLPFDPDRYEHTRVGIVGIVHRLTHADVIIPRDVLAALVAYVETTERLSETLPAALAAREEYVSGVLAGLPAGRTAQVLEAIDTHNAANEAWQAACTRLHEVANAHVATPATEDTSATTP